MPSSALAPADATISVRRLPAGRTYLEIDMDVHNYAYLARKVFHGFTQRLHAAVFENAFVVQGGWPAGWGGAGRGMGAGVGEAPGTRTRPAAGAGARGISHPGPHSLAAHPTRAGNRPEELPEQVLAAARVYRADLSRAKPFPARWVVFAGVGSRMVGWAAPGASKPPQRGAGSRVASGTTAVRPQRTTGRGSRQPASAALRSRR